MKFTKMHGIGNDYVYINAGEYPIHAPHELAVRVSDRHCGIGSTLILITPSSVADVGMRDVQQRRQRIGYAATASVV